jgi:hypothetical protein
MSGLMTSDARKPPDACHAIWQWKAQIPAAVHAGQYIIITLSHRRVSMWGEEGEVGGRRHTRGAVDLDHEMAVAAHEVDVPPMGVRRADDGAVPGARPFV